MKKILVTGATGFLGSHLIPKLIKDGNIVRIFKQKSESIEFLKEYDLEIVNGDIRNLGSVEKAVNGCDIVFHLAGIISYWSKLNSLQYDVNVKGTQNIVKACIENNIEKLIHVSSVSAIGTSKKGLADENTIYNLFPLKVNYCDTKFLGEVEVLKGISKGLNAVIASPCSVFGTKDKRRINSDMIFSFKFPMNLFYLNKGIAVVDVEDVVNGLIKMWKKDNKGEKYILSGQNLSFYEIRKTIAQALGKRTPFICLPNWFLIILSYIFLGISKITKKKPKLTPEMIKFNKINLFFSNEKAKKELNIKFKSFEQSINEAVVWYKENNYI